jgi:SAM-dependent methyltransferase
MDKEWFESWFETPYYAMLYRNRNDLEAEFFVKKLVEHLKLKPGHRVADVACGSGRHSAVFHALGLNVWGYDLSERFIGEARSLCSQAVFTRHDMRHHYDESEMDAVFNLFTSFGYFETREEDVLALRNMANLLGAEGVLVQDYINGMAVLPQLPVKMNDDYNGVHFEIEKHWQPPYIVKKIDVNDAGRQTQYIEKVRVYEYAELKQLHREAGLEPVEVYGDYHLAEYSPLTSPRMVIISKKHK